MRKKEMVILANLKSIVILDCDKDALYKKVQSDLLVVHCLCTPNLSRVCTSQLTVYFVVLVAMFILNLLSGVSSVS